MHVADKVASRTSTSSSTPMTLLYPSAALLQLNIPRTTFPSESQTGTCNISQVANIKISRGRALCNFDLKGAQCGAH